MKYLKKYESKNSDIIITFDLFDFCNYIGGIRKAILEITELRYYSTGVGFTIFGNKHEHYYSIKDELFIYETTKQSNFDTNDEDSIAIRIGDYSISYGELREYSNHNMGLKIFFYNTSKIDDEALLYINSLKYNI